MSDVGKDNIISKMTLTLIILLHLPALQSLFLKRISVPNYGVKDKHAVLVCEYDSQGEQIYSIKWYKGGKEFFSYLPGKIRPTTFHAMPGVHVDLSQSDENKVTLRHLSLATTGRYRCEVSSEAPMFVTDSGYGDLLVVVVPQDGPVIEGAEDRYRPGQRIQLNCTTHATKPPANLTWYINQEPVPDRELVRYPVINISHRPEDLHTTTLGLNHEVTRQDFSNARHMKLKCVASIYDAYYKVNEISAEKARKRRKAKNNHIENNHLENNRVSQKGKNSDASSRSDFLNSGDQAGTMTAKSIFLTLLLALFSTSIINL